MHKAIPLKHGPTNVKKQPTKKSKTPNKHSTIQSKKISPKPSPLHFLPSRPFSTTTPPQPDSPTSTPNSLQSTQNGKLQQQEDEEAGLEVITRTPTPKRSAAPIVFPKRTTPKPKVTKHYNSALAGETIPEEGVIIFEHKARGWLQAVPPMAAGTSIGMPIFAGIAAYVSNFNPELMTVFGCATLSTFFAAYQAYKFTQSHVHLIRIKQENLIEFETFGFFGYKRYVSYPANYVYPLLADPDHGMFGYKVKFVPIIQELNKNPGSLHTFDSGLVVAPDVNCKTGNAKNLWEQLLTGSAAFAEVDELTEKRKIATMV
jgi:hypothetical protein